MKRKSLSVYAQVKRMTTKESRSLTIRRQGGASPTLDNDNANDDGQRSSRKDARKSADLYDILREVATSKETRRRSEIKAKALRKDDERGKQQENKTDITCSSLPLRPRCSAVFEVRRKELAKTGPARPRNWISTS